MNKKKPNYGNWVPEKMLKGLLALAVVLFVLTVVFAKCWLPVLAWICGILCALVTVFLIYMYVCHELFAFDKGNRMAQVHEHLVRHLDWNGKGTLLDIGCGAGALTIRCAKAFPKATVTGMDYWGKEWSYAKSQCEENAKIEGVAERVHFEQGDAAKLPYEDESFDAVVSNFVFHEVKTAKDKKDVVREALRVVKKGGSFAFQDLFDQKQLYGDIHELVNELKKEGISEIHYAGNLEDLLRFPDYAKTPWMINGVGILYGKK